MMWDTQRIFCEIRESVKPLFPHFCKGQLECPKPQKAALSTLLPQLSIGHLVPDKKSWDTRQLLAVRLAIGRPSQQCKTTQIKRGGSFLTNPSHWILNENVNWTQTLRLTTSIKYWRRCANIKLTICISTQNGLKKLKIYCRILKNKLKRLTSSEKHFISWNLYKISSQHPTCWISHT